MRSLLCALIVATGCAIEYRIPTESEDDTDTDDGSDDDGTADIGDGECLAPRVLCGDECVDLLADPNHCGDCTEQCDPGGSCNQGDCIDACGDSCEREHEVCVDGTCACRSGFAACDGECVDLAIDPDHCGDCDRECGGDVCGDGDCVPDCGAFPDRCGDSCVDVQSDPSHCGECDDPCDGDEFCNEGHCEDID